MSTRRYSIRDRLVGRTLACILLIFAAISLAAHLFARHESQEFFSARLASSARVLDSLTAHRLESATGEAPVVIALPREIGATGGPSGYGHPYEHKIAFQIWRDDGRLLARSASAPASPFGPRAAGFGQNEIDGTLWQVFTLRSGRSWVQVAEKEEVRDEMVHQLAMSVLVPLLVGAVVLVLAVNLLLSANLAPLRELADSIARREPESLAPVEPAGMPDELAPVIDELNSLLLRVRRAFEREQQFIDAAAHEIRTPIAAVQLHVQNALRARDGREREQSLGEAAAALKRTTLLAGQLLTFSRLASRTDLVRHQRLSLAEVCRDVMQFEEPLLARCGQTLGLDAPVDYPIEGDPYRLQQLLRNLIDNASRHGRAHGDIDVSIGATADKVLLQVANDGDPIPEHEIERIFQPYYRLQPGNDSGAGLGLSIVKEIADQHKAKIAVGRKPNHQGCVVSVSFDRIAASLPQAAPAGKSQVESFRHR